MVVHVLVIREVMVMHWVVWCRRWWRVVRGGWLVVGGWWVVWEWWAVVDGGCWMVSCER